MGVSLVSDECTKCVGIFKVSLLVFGGFSQTPWNASGLQNTALLVVSNLPSAVAIDLPYPPNSQTALNFLIKFSALHLIRIHEVNTYVTFTG